MFLLLVVLLALGCAFDTSELAFRTDGGSLRNIKDVTCANLSNGRMVETHCWCNLAHHPAPPGGHPESVLIKKKEFERNNYRKQGCKSERMFSCCSDSEFGNFFLFRLENSAQIFSSKICLVENPMSKVLLVENFSR